MQSNLFSTVPSITSVILVVFFALLSNAVSTQNSFPADSKTAAPPSESSEASQEKLQRILACRQAYLQSKIKDLVACIDNAQQTTTQSIRLETPKSQTNERKHQDDGTSSNSNVVIGCNHTNPFLIVECVQTYTVQKETKEANANFEKIDPNFDKPLDRTERFKPHYYWGMGYIGGGVKGNIEIEDYSDSFDSVLGFVFSLAQELELNKVLRFSLSTWTAVGLIDSDARVTKQSLQAMYLSEQPRISSGLFLHNFKYSTYYGYGLKLSKITNSYEDFRTSARTSSDAEIAPVLSIGAGTFLGESIFDKTKGGFLYIELQSSYSQEYKSMENIFSFGFSLGRIK